MAGKLNVADYLSRLPSTLTPAHPHTITPTETSSLTSLGGMTSKITRFADVDGLPLASFQLFCRGHFGVGMCVCGTCDMQSGMQSDLAVA